MSKATADFLLAAEFWHPKKPTLNKVEFSCGKTGFPSFSKMSVAFKEFSEWGGKRGKTSFEPSGLI